MEAYKDMANPAIATYEIGNDFIKIQFKSGRIYKYSYRSATEKHVEKMKLLAQNGKGLDDYIFENINKKSNRQQGPWLKRIIGFFKR